MTQANNEPAHCPFVEAQDDPVAQLSGNLTRLTKFFQHLKHQNPQMQNGIDAAGYPLLFTLAHGSLRISTLAEKVYSDVSTASRQIAALEKRGYVARTPDPADGRASLVAITTEGAAFITGLVDRRTEFFRGILHDWSAEDVHLLATLLARLHHDAAERGPALLNPANAQGGHQ